MLFQVVIPSYRAANLDPIDSLGTNKMASRSIKNVIKESFWMAIDAIRKNKLRSSLTLLGISIGVFSVIGVMTAIRTLESSVNSGLNVFATNTFVIQKYPEIEFGDRRGKYRNRKNINNRSI